MVVCPDLFNLKTAISALAEKLGNTHTFTWPNPGSRSSTVFYYVQIHAVFLVQLLRHNNTLLPLKREVHLITCHKGKDGEYRELYYFFDLGARCGV